MAEVPFAAVSGGLGVRVRLTPKAARNAFGGTVADAQGIPAKSWRVAKTSISIKSGAGHRQKTLLVEGDTEMLFKKLRNWMESIGGEHRWLRRESSTARRSPPGSGKKSPPA